MRALPIIFESAPDALLYLPHRPPAHFTMSKRTAAELQATSSSEAKKPFGAPSKKVEDEGMGEFEDAWEDEIESDEEVAEGQNDDGAHRSIFPLDTILTALAA